MIPVIKKTFALLCATLLLICPLGCRRNHTPPLPPKPGEKLKVLSSISIIDDIVRQIGGDLIDAQTLIRHQLDPHTYQLVKGDNEKLSSADIIFYNGLGLEHGPSLQNFLKNNPNAYSLGNIIKQKEPQAIIYHNGSPDPHIWMDISLWTQTASIIADKLSAADPKNAATFQKNGASLGRQMLRLHHSLKAAMKKIPKKERYLVTSHNAFNYFVRGYLATTAEIRNEKWRKRCESPEGLAPESMLSSYDLRRTLDYIKRYRIRVLFPESNISRLSIEKITNAGWQMGLKLRIADAPLYSDTMGPPGSDGDSYLKMMSHNAHIVTNNLRQEINE